MRKNIRNLLAAIAVSLMAGPVLAANVSIEFRLSPMLGLFDFALALTGDPHSASNIQEIFEKSTYNNVRTRASLKLFSEAREAMNLAYNFKDAMPARSPGQDIKNLYTIQSIMAVSLRDFKLRTSGLLPVAAQAKVFEALAELEPVYNNLIWKPSYNGLKKYQTAMETMARQNHLEISFEKARRFYQAQWPSDLPFIIGLHPVPYARTGSFRTFAASTQNVEEMAVGISEEARDITPSYAVMFHELCHSLYESEPLSFQRQFEDFFKGQNTIHAFYSYVWANEVIATALGNGWIYEQVKGHQDGGGWYNNNYINSLAKAIYPMTKDYMSKGKSLDQNYVSALATEFKKLFPDVAYEYDNIFNKVLALSNRNIISSRNLKSAFDHSFRASSWSYSSPVLDSQTFDAIKSAPDTLLVVMTPEELGQIDKLAEHVVGLSDELEQIHGAKGDFIFSQPAERGRAMVLIVTSQPAKLNQALIKLKALKKFDPRQQIINF